MLKPGAQVAENRGGTDRGVHVPSETSHRPRWADDLLDLAAEEATGRLVVVSESGEEGWIQLRDGSLAAVSAAARRPLLSRRLTAFEVMSAQDVRTLKDRVRQTPGARLLDLLIHERLVPETFAQGYLRNTMAEQLGALMDEKVAQVRFEPGRIQPMPMLQSAHEVLATAVAVPHEFPPDMADRVLRGADGAHADLVPILRSVIRAADGHARPVDVADACGLTAAETLQVITDLRSRQLLEVVVDHDRESWHTVGSLSLAPPSGPAMPAPPLPAAGHSTPQAPAASAPAPAAAAAAPPPQPPAAPPPVIKPFAPAPVEPEPEIDVRPAAAAGADNRREALSALKNLTEAVAAQAEPPVPHVPPVKDPQSEVTTTSPRIWANRPSRPADPMESGDVLRELKSLGD